MMEHIIRLEDFEGPLDLMIELIKKREYDINNLPISSITRDYLANMEHMKKQHIEVTSDFMELASLLLQIKTRLLLPVDEKTDDPRNELVKQLLDYQIYKESVEKMKELHHIEQRFFKSLKKMVVRKKKPGTVEDIFKSYQEMLNKKFAHEENNRLEKLTQELNSSNFTIEERIVFIKELLKNQDVDIPQLFDTINDREEAIVTFSALLEIIKSQFALIVMDENDTVIISKKGEANE
jgi:segregation and condensation protein A